jgi:hypothetical protein
MKVRSGPNVRIMTQVVRHYQHAVSQHVGDTATTPAIGAPRKERTVNVINLLGNGARKSRVLKSGTRRITY